MQIFKGCHRFLQARKAAQIQAAFGVKLVCSVDEFNAFRHIGDESPAELPPPAPERVDYESHIVALDRNELGALLVAAGLGAPSEYALISLLALNGLRVPEATGADIEHLGLERGHRTLTITWKGGKVVTVPMAPRTARTIDPRRAHGRPGVPGW